MPIRNAVTAANNPAIGHENIIGKFIPPKYPVLAGSKDSIQKIARKVC